MKCSAATCVQIYKEKVKGDMSVARWGGQPHSLKTFTEQLFHLRYSVRRIALQQLRDFGHNIRRLSYLAPVAKFGLSVGLLRTEDVPDILRDVHKFPRTSGEGNDLEHSCNGIDHENSSATYLSSVASCDGLNYSSLEHADRPGFPERDGRVETFKALVREHHLPLKFGSPLLLQSSPKTRVSASRGTPRRASRASSAQRARRWAQTFPT